MDSVKVKVKEYIKVDSVNENKKKNETLTTELYFELLKQIAWLSSATIGAIIIFIQIEAIVIDSIIYLSLVSLALSVFISILGQEYIVDSLLKGKDIYKISKVLKLYRYASVFALGLGVGVFAAGF